MITSILESCQRINFEINLFGLLKGLSILVLIIVVVLLEKKIVSIVKKESIIDERVRETSARIARIVSEMEEFKERSDVGEERIETMQPQTQTQSQTSEETPNELDTSSQRDSDKVPKVKKTRAMSMEERWADFDKKRAIRNTA
ncbi:hypothetical protein [Desulfosporosinus sp. SB140]|uniref:hypothetical protein n=1 Tax=Desulfosporosinus paludis TaxID=3115649 RepID=UPI00388E05AD